VKAPRIVIADDHALVRAAVRTVLEAEGFAVCAEAGDADGAVAAVLAIRPELCLLDVHMPGSGIAAARSVLRVAPETAVVMLTVSENDDDLFDALRAGASGYVLKDAPRHALAAALRDVLAGNAALPPVLLARVLDEFRDRRARRVLVRRDRRAALTQREWTVLELLREGLTTADIASRLFVTPATVRSHVSAILEKLGAADRDEAVRLLSP
jgi:DNA-binding NarL/FixJ family response regulator